MRHQRQRLCYYVNSVTGKDRRLCTLFVNCQNINSTTVNTGWHAVISVYKDIPQWTAAQQGFLLPARDMRLRLSVSVSSFVVG